uniref:Ribosomal protein S5 n=1 Tax=Panagrolaimus sp. JU765 TaxID=591449 RepID=A0AC34RMM6_9BILA
MNKNWEHPEVQKLLHHRLIHKEPRNKVGVSTVKDKIFKMKLSQSQNELPFLWQPFPILDDNFIISTSTSTSEIITENSEIKQEIISSSSTPAEISEEEYYVNPTTTFNLLRMSPKSQTNEHDFGFGFEISDPKYLFKNRPKLLSNFGNIEYGENSIILKQARCSLQIHLKDDYSGIKHVTFTSGGNSKTFHHFSETDPSTNALLCAVSIAVYEARKILMEIKNPGPGNIDNLIVQVCGNNDLIYKIDDEMLIIPNGAELFEKSETIPSIVSTTKKITLEIIQKSFDDVKLFV